MCLHPAQSAIRAIVKSAIGSSGDGLAVDHRGNSMRCRLAALGAAFVIGGALTAGQANAQYYPPPNSPYAQPPYPPRYAMPPDVDDEEPMYDPRMDAPPPRSAAVGPQYGPYGPPPYAGPPAPIPDEEQGGAYGVRPPGPLA